MSSNTDTVYVFDHSQELKDNLLHLQTDGGDDVKVKQVRIAMVLHRSMRRFLAQVTFAIPLFYNLYF